MDSDLFKLTTILLVVALTPSALASDANNYFTNPPMSGLNGDYDNNESFEVGQKINLTWLTNYTSIGLSLWQQLGEYNASTINIFNDQAPARESYEWTVNASSFNLNNGNVFYFQIAGNSSNASGVFTCHYFNIQAAASSTSSSTSMSSISPTSTSAASTATSTGAPVHAKQLTTGDKAGIGVAVGVAGVLFVALVAWLLWRRRRQHMEASGSGGRAPDMDALHTTGKGQPAELGDDTQRHELEPKGFTHELPSNWLAHELPSNET